jgi:hypothetical protein
LRASRRLGRDGRYELRSAALRFGLKELDETRRAQLNDRLEHPQIGRGGLIAAG